MTETTSQATAARPRAAITRRTFARTAATGIAGILALRRPPAAWAARELTLLTAVNYAPTSDVKLTELGRRFTKATGVGVRTDHMQSVQMPAKLSAELMSQGGHDIVSLEMHYPWLFAPGLADVSDLANDLAAKHGEWYPFAKEHAYVKGRWLGVPYLYLSFPGSHRIDLFEKIGEKAPDTWEDLLRAGRTLKKLGHPVGFAISQTTDSVTTLSSILWCFGAKDVAPDGRTVAIRSKETETAVDYVRALYADAMDPVVLSWDNAANNQWLNSGAGSWIHNPISHYVVAKEKKMPIAEQIGFHLSPAGPDGIRSGFRAASASGSSARTSTSPANSCAGSSSPRSTTSGSCRATTTTIPCGETWKTMRCGRWTRSTSRSRGSRSTRISTGGRRRRTSGFR